MLPPGRRRTAAFSPLTLCLALLLLFTSTAHAAGSVLGLDFGTLNLKAALVKPGIPLEIVLTKDSKRKETAAVAFKPNRDGKNNVIAELGTFPERAYGSDALALQGRVPGEVHPNLKPLLGLSSNDDANEAIQAYKGRYPAVQVEHVKELGTTLFKSAAFVDQEMPWSVEELLAMQLVNIRRNAEAMAGKGASVEDVVITVPAFYTGDERRAIEKAATLAGLDVNALVSDGLAVGLDYAKTRTFPEVTKGEQSEYHLVFDMGAGSTTATLLRFQSRSVKDVGRFNKTVQEVAVLGTGWDRTLGGDSLTSVIVNDFVHKFMTKPVIKSRGTTIDSVKTNGRLMSRLWKDAEKARQVLSANAETTSSFEELLPEIDFKTKLKRTEFESLTSSFADRVAGPIRDALAAAKMEMKDVDSIILHGGAVRTPFVQKKLEEIAGGSSKLRSNVNADESAVFGAAFKGASLSPSFKVKEIRDSDVAGYAAGMEYMDGEKARKQTLFADTSPVGHGAATKQVTFKDKHDFSFGLYQQIGEVGRPVTRIETRNLTAGVKALKDKWGCEKDEISTKFSIKLSPINGLPEVIGGSVSCEVEGSGKGESIGDSVKDWLGFGKKKGDQDPLKEGEEDAGETEQVEAATSTSTSESESATDSASATSSKAPEKPKKRTESMGISFTVIPQGNVQPSTEEMNRMRDRLAAFDRSDRARVKREEVLNVLEGYTYFVRDLLSNSDFEPYSTKSQRDELSKLLENTRSFMEDHKEVSKATEESLKEKHRALNKLVEPITTRRREEEDRPERVQQMRNSLEQTQKLVEMVKAQVEQAADVKKKAEEFDVSQSPSASSTADSASATSTDDLADLEEPDTASPTTSDFMPKYSGAADFSPYTELDLTGISDAYEKAKQWLDEKVAEQAKLKPYDEPVLLTKDIEKKASELSEAMKDLLYKKMKATTSKKTSAKTKSSKKSKSTSGEASQTGEQPVKVTVGADREVPTEEEILEMVSSARASQSSSSSEREHVIDEL